MQPQTHQSRSHKSKANDAATTYNWWLKHKILRGHMFSYLHRSQQKEKQQNGVSSELGLELE
jgi:hypothetical protein